MEKIAYNEPTEAQNGGKVTKDTVNFKYVPNYDPKKFCRNINGGLTKLATVEETKYSTSLEYFC